MWQARYDEDSEDVVLAFFYPETVAASCANILMLTDLYYHHDYECEGLGRVI